MDMSNGFPTTGSDGQTPIRYPYGPETPCAMGTVKPLALTIGALEKGDVIAARVNKVAMKIDTPKDVWAPLSPAVVYEARGSRL
jgi:hypothetical protein